MTDRVDPAEQAMKPPSCCRPAHRTFGIAEWTEQLANRHHPVLALRKRSQSVVSALAGSP